MILESIVIIGFALGLDFTFGDPKNRYHPTAWIGILIAKLTPLTKIPVLGTIPMLKMNLPEEDSLNVKAKEIAWTKNNISKIDKELDKLAKVVKNNLDLKKIEMLIK